MYYYLFKYYLLEMILTDVKIFQFCFCNLIVIGVLKVWFIQFCVQSNYFHSKCINQCIHVIIYLFIYFVVYLFICLFVCLFIYFFICTGKTRSAIGVSAVYVKEWPVLIVCPSSARHHWRAELISLLSSDYISCECYLLLLIWMTPHSNKKNSNLLICWLLFHIAFI